MMCWNNRMGVVTVVITGTHGKDGRHWRTGCKRTVRF